MRLMDKEYRLKKQGYPRVGTRHTRHLLRLMGLMAIYPSPNLSRRAPDHKTYPYLLRSVPIILVNQVWNVDIMYIRLKDGFIYLVTIMD